MVCHLKKSLFILAVVLNLLNCWFYCCGKNLPKCKLNEDTKGQWIDTPRDSTITVTYGESGDKDIIFSDYLEHFHDLHGVEGPGEATFFDQLWLPEGCSYHRFTNHSLHRCVNRIVEERRVSTIAETNDKKPIQVVFIGDSSSRGLFCGITRIVSGSEVYGPCENNLCSTQSNKVAEAITVPFFEGMLELIFIYVQTFDYPRVDWIIYDTIPSKPLAIIMNTGAWSFDALARAHRETEAPVYCENDDPDAVGYAIIARGRASAEFNKSMWELSELARQHDVRLIYRNNHFNFRFGAHCADDRIEKALEGSGWEIFDNREISKDVWRQQTFDGFHFDRGAVASVEDHLNLIHSQIYDAKCFGAVCNHIHWPNAGQLEQQLSQSLLNSLFHKCLE